MSGIFVVECTIYRSIKKADTYLYIEKKDEFGRVPKPLMDMLGRLEFVMELDLDQRVKLAQAESSQVKDSLVNQGYFLQLPPKAYLGNSA